jgi:hypothetical protein
MSGRDIPVSGVDGKGWFEPDKPANMQLTGSNVPDDQALPTKITAIQRVLAFSTTTPLAANAVYTSPTIDVINYKSLLGRILTDQAGSYVLQHSDDGITWDSQASSGVGANAFATPGGSAYGRYMRVVYTNGAAAQTKFILSMYLFPL